MGRAAEPFGIGVRNGLTHLRQARRSIGIESFDQFLYQVGSSVVGKLAECLGQRPTCVMLGNPTRTAIGVTIHVFHGGTLRILDIDLRRSRHERNSPRISATSSPW